jgi:hypothetical protein
MSIDLHWKVKLQGPIDLLVLLQMPNTNVAMELAI